MDLVEKKLINVREVKISQQSVSLMNETIFDSINRTVGTNDRLVIVGDFCYGQRHDTRHILAKEFRDKINCQNVYLIYGNHDDRSALSRYFTACYDQFTFSIDNRKVFACHYPCRSWEGKGHEIIHVYGHVHGLLAEEDEGGILPYQKKLFSEGFQRVLEKYGSYNHEIIRDLLDVVASANGADYTLDVGVDVRKGVPFGTPWSMKEIVDHMNKKKMKVEAKKALIGNAQ